jgi:hypothetical protein
VPVTWITDADVKDALGLAAADVTDDAFITDCTNAANAVAWRRRQAAGYITDVEATVPDDAVKLGTVMFAVARYRERGAVDGYASFDPLGTFVPSGGSWGTIQKLWGTNRPVAV